MAGPPVLPCAPSQPVCSHPFGLLSLVQAAKPLLTTALYLYGWCQKNVARFFQIVKNAAFPSSVYLRELHALRERLEKLEIEFARLQSAVQASSLIRDVPMQITLRDLQNVKLRKAQGGVRTDKLQTGSPSERHKVFVTPADLQSVSLKCKTPRPPASVKHHLISPSRNGIDFRKHLKKVAIERSQAIEGFIGDNQHLELGPDFNGDPVKLTEDWGYMRTMLSPHQQPGSSVLHQLKYPDRLQGQPHVERIAEV
ncbi:Proline-rich protein 11 [Varanus komodoensis]|nr:Proline-rich protein 11 [Varanus komodoensis]